MSKLDFKQQAAQLRAKQNAEIKRLRAKGLTTQEIADTVGITRQALDMRELRMRANGEGDK